MICNQFASEIFQASILGNLPREVDHVTPRTPEATALEHSAGFRAPGPDESQHRAALPEIDGQPAARLFTEETIRSVVSNAIAAAKDVGNSFTTRDAWMGICMIDLLMIRSGLFNTELDLWLRKQRESIYE